METLQPHPLRERIITPPVLIGVFLTIGAVGLLFSTIVTNPYTILYPLMLIVGPVLYLVIRELPLSQSTSIKAPKVLKGGLILYIVLFTVLVAIYYSAGFYRTETVFHFTFVLYILTAILIWLRPTPIFGLTLLCVTGLINRLTAYYASALYVGNDYYTHYPWVAGIVKQGSLVPLYHDKYYYAPFYHLLTAISDIVMAVPVKDAGALTTVTVVTVIPVLVVFTIISYFWNSRVAIMGAFLYMASDYAIYFGHYAVTTSLGLVVFSVFLLSLFRYNMLRPTTSNAQAKRLFSGLTIVFLAVLSATHQVSLFIAVVFVCSYLGARVLYELTLRRHVMLISAFSGLVLFTDFMTTKRLGPASERTFIESYLGLVISRFPTAGATSRQTATLPQDQAISGVGAAGLDLVQVAGAAIFLCFAVAGVLYWLRSTQSSRQVYTILGFGVSVTTMYGIALGFPAIAIGDLLPSRWFPFIYLLLAVFAAPAVVAVIRAGADHFGRNHLYGPIVMLIIISLPFVVLMAGNHVGASDDPYLDDAPGAERFGVTESEKALFNHTAEYENERVLTDRRAAIIFSQYYEIDVNVLKIEYGEPETIPRPSLIVERAYIHTSQSQYQIEYEKQVHDISGSFPVEGIVTTTKNEVYNNGNDELTYVTSNQEAEDDQS